MYVVSGSSPDWGRSFHFLCFDKNLFTVFGCQACDTSLRFAQPLGAPRQVQERDVSFEKLKSHILANQGLH